MAKRRFPGGEKIEHLASGLKRAHSYLNASWALRGKAHLYRPVLTTEGAHSPPPPSALEVKKQSLKCLRTQEL